MQRPFSVRSLIMQCPACNTIWFLHFTSNRLSALNHLNVQSNLYPKLWKNVWRKEVLSSKDMEILKYTSEFYLGKVTFQRMSLKPRPRFLLEMYISSKYQFSVSYM